LRILRGAGWPVQFHEFDPPENFSERDICQLIPDTADGFPEIENQELVVLWQGNQDSNTYPLHHRSSSDPPRGHLQENCYDPPHAHHE